MIIAALGYADKRPVLYALMKLLQSFGDVAVITQNRQLQRLLGDRGISGYFNNVFVKITDLKPEEAFPGTEYSYKEFDHIIFDSIDMLPESYDICIHSRSFGLTEREEEFIGRVNDIVRYNFMYGGKPETGCVNIPVTFELIRSVEEFEARGFLLPVQSEALLRNLSKLSAAYLKIPEKNALKILKRRWNER